MYEPAKFLLQQFGLILAGIALSVVLLVLTAVVISRITRWVRLRKMGFYVGWEWGRGAVYEERHNHANRFVPLKTVSLGHGGGHIMIPTQQEWKDNAPEWARERRDEIFMKVIQRWPKVRVHYPEDWVRRLDNDSIK